MRLALVRRTVRRRALLVRALACAALLTLPLLACASSPSTPGPALADGPPESASATALVDEDLLAELVPLARALIRTGGPQGGGFRAALRLVDERLQAAGVFTERHASASAESLLARIPGAEPSAPPLLLVAHADTFPADPAAWPEDAPPFDGALVGEHLVGRGALDMHGPLALYTLGLVQLARLDERPHRDVLLLVTSDGEGAQLAIREALSRWPRLRFAEPALGKGGFLLEDGLRAGEDAVLVTHGEKGRLHVRLSTQGEALPAERATEPSAPGRLLQALGRVIGSHPEPRVPAALLPTARALLEARGGPLALLAQSDATLALVAEDVLAQDPLGAPLLASTCALLTLRSGAPTPVVPPWAEAELDCRLVPGQAPSAFRDRLLLAIDDPRVTLEVLDAVPASSSPPTGRLLEVLAERLAAERPGAPLLSVMSAKRTELGWLRARGIPAYGFAPLRVDRDELQALHGPNERVRVRELKDALNRVVDLMRALARAP